MNKKKTVLIPIMLIILILVLSAGLFAWQQLSNKKGDKNTKNFPSLPLISEQINMSVPVSKPEKAVPAPAIPPDSGFSFKLPILMYHYVEIAPASSTLPGLYLDPKIFSEQLATLQKNNYQSLFVSEAARELKQNIKPEGNKIVLTFDDGYEDFYTAVFPLLKQYNYKATLYVIINALDTKGYLTRAQVRELAASGLVEIGSHTFNHPDLRKLKAKDIKFEIDDSKKILAQISGQPVLSFAYPYGYYEADFFPLLSTAGYSAAVSVIPGDTLSAGNIWLMPRLRPGERVGEVLIKWLANWEK